MSTISVYTYCTNSIRDEFFLIEGIKSALLFADEVVVMDGCSEDNTIEQIEKIGDKRIKIYQNKWLDSLGKSMGAINRSLSIGRCTSDWCILMDSDEVYHEKDVDRIKKISSSISSNIIAVEFNTLHFYKDYKHIMNGCGQWKDLYERKVYMVRNGMSIHHGAIGMEPDGHVDINGKPVSHNDRFTSNVTVFHYGHARTKKSYVKKYNRIEGRHKGFDNYKPITEEEFSWLHDWQLNDYNDSHPKVMENRINAGLDSYERIMELYK